MKVQIIALKNCGEMKAGKEYEAYRETADILVKHGKAQYKVDYLAEQRQKKIVEPEKTKHWNDLPPELEKIANNPPKRKYTRRK